MSMTVKGNNILNRANQIDEKVKESFAVYWLVQPRSVQEPGFSGTKKNF